MTDSLFLVCTQHQQAISLMDEDGQNYDEEQARPFLFEHAYCHPTLIPANDLTIVQWKWVKQTETKDT